jgi:hypothetical protein
MQKTIICCLLLCGAACNSDTKNSEKKDTATTGEPKIEMTSSAATTASSSLPPYVVFKNWEVGDPRNAELVLNVYKAWDKNTPGEMATYFADSAAYDLPDGNRRTTNNKNVEATFRKWRSGYKETSNIPFSLISLHSKDRQQDWVIAWTWNKWTTKAGGKDSMLYCDNWRIRDGKIEYLNSLESFPSKQLSRTLNKGIPGLRE